MQSNKIQIPKIYLLKILHDGAKPFLYRKGVRSLLGMPESEEKHLTFAPMMPPVGFKYINFSYAEDYNLNDFIPQTNNPNPLHLNETRIKRLDKGDHSQKIPSTQMQVSDSSKNISNAEPLFREKQVTPMSTSVGILERTLQSNISASPKLQQHKSAQLPVKEDGKEKSIEANEPGEITEQKLKPEAGIEKLTIQMPGLTKMAQTFPALKSESDNDSFTQHEKIKSSQNKTSVTSSKTNISKSPSDPILQTKGEKFQNKDKISGEQTQPTFNAISSKKAQAQPSLSQPNIGNLMPQISQKPEAARPAIKQNQTSQIGQYQELQRLRRAVHDFSLKEKPKHGKPPEVEQVKPNKKAPSPPRQVVIVRKTINQSKSTHAFWERRYLGRFHFKPLR